MNTLLPRKRTPALFEAHAGTTMESPRRPTSTLFWAFVEKAHQQGLYPLPPLPARVMCFSAYALAPARSLCYISATAIA
jgi:hypothetical protein